MTIFDTITNKEQNIAIYNFTIKTLQLQHVSILWQPSAGRKINKILYDINYINKIIHDVCGCPGMHGRGTNVNK